MQNFQFSKKIVITCFILSTIAILLALALSLFGISEIIASSIIAAYGCMGVTSIVWYLKKSQSENIVKIYLGAYKEILQLKNNIGESQNETIEQMESDILGKLNSNLSYAMDEANSPIEKQDIY